MLRCAGTGVVCQGGYPEVQHHVFDRPYSVAILQLCRPEGQSLHWRLVLDSMFADFDGCQLAA